MELRQLEYVLAVAELRSFTRAARRCHVVQSALSQQVARLERDLGTRLFDRTSRSVTITAAGEAFLPGARQALAAAERARSDAAAADGVVRGPLRLGAIAALTAVEPATLIARFRSEYPDVAVSLAVAGSDELVTSVRARELEVAFIGVPPDYVATGLREHELAGEELVAVVPAGHRFSSARRRRLADFADAEFVDLPAGSAARLQSDRAFGRAGVERRVGYEVGHLGFAVEFAAQGLAVALVPAGYDLRGRTDVRVVRLVDAPVRSQRVVWRDPASSAARALLAAVPVSP